jgi:hypothetical protein
MLIELAVDGRRIKRYVGMCGGKCGYPFRGRE